MRLVLSLFFAGCLVQTEPTDRNQFREPIGDKDALIFLSDGHGIRYVDCLNRKTGKTTWEKDRCFGINTDNEDRRTACFTPCVIRQGDRWELINPAAITTGERIRENGDLFWTERTGGTNFSSSPIYRNGMVFAFSGRGSIAVVNPGGKGDADKNHLARVRRMVVPKKSSNFLLGNSSFVVSDQGVASYNGPETGKIHWTESLGAKNESASSPVQTNEKTYFFSNDDGKSVICEPEPKDLRDIGPNKLDDCSTVSPAIAGDSLLDQEVVVSPDKNPVAGKLDFATDDLTKDSNQSLATQGWNLFVLRELALKHSPDVLLKKAELRISERGIPVIKFGKMPTVKAKASFDDYEKVSQFETYSEPEPYNTFSYGLESRWVLYDGHKNRKEVNIARNEVNQAQWTLYVEEQKVLKNLTNLFFSAVSTQTQMQFLPKIEEISNEKLSVYEKKLKTGIVDRILFSDSLRDLESIRAQILNNAHSLEVAKAEIGFLLNADGAFWGKFKEFVIPEDFESKNDFNPENSYSANLGQAGIDIAKSKYDEIKTGYSPVLEFIGSAGHRSKNRIGFEKHGQELTLGLSLTIPITDRYLTRRKLEQAREEIRKSELEKVRLVTRQRNEFSSEKLRLSQAERSLDFQKEMLDLQKKRLADVMSASALGIYDKSDVLLEEEKLLKREMYVELTRLNYVKQKYQLDLIE